jgi:hypothetical protein
VIELRNFQSLSMVELVLNSEYALMRANVDRRDYYCGGGYIVW